MASRLPLVAALVLASCAGTTAPPRAPIESEPPPPTATKQEPAARYCADGGLVDSVKGLKLEPPSLDGHAHEKIVLFTKETPSEKTEAITAGGCSVAPALAACRKTAAPKFAGYVELTVDVDAKGQLVSALRAGGSLDEELTKCMQTALATGQFGSAAHGRTSLLLVVRPAARIVRMIESGTDIAGALPPEVIKREVRKNFPALRKCFEDLAKGEPGIDQLARLRFIIDEKGKPTDVEVATPDPVFRACLGTVVSGLSFEHPEKGKVLVKYPIRFQSDD